MFGIVLVLAKVLLKYVIASYPLRLQIQLNLGKLSTAVGDVFKLVKISVEEYSLPLTGIQQLDIQAARP